MATLVREIAFFYNDLMINKSDYRTKEWPMMSSPLPTLLVCLSYAYFAKVLGPSLMHNRKPFKLKNILIVYNLLQTIFSAWIFYEYLMSGWWGDYSFRCQPVDYSRSEKAMRMAATSWWYFFSKFTEFFDTLFFILRKKNEHVSTLHVIHHGCMPMSVWFGVKFTPGGHSTFFALLNTFVHIVMYFYYMVSAMGPEYQKYIWWKKHLTTFQMVQFVAIFVHQFQLLVTPCDYPKAFVYFIAFHGILFLFLFSNFYRTKYNSRKANKNGGVCMAVYNNNDEATKTTTAATKYNEGENGYTKAYPTHFAPCYSHGEQNGFVSPPANGSESAKDK